MELNSTSSTISLPTSVRIGRTWFHWRSLSPIPLFLLMFLLRPDAQWSPRQSGLLLFAVLIGEGIRLWAVGFAGSRTRTRGDTVAQLVHAGPYRYVRNPLYIANVILYTACSLSFGFLNLSWLVFAYSSIEYIFIVAFEEQVLTDTFGAAYTQYCSKVPRWIPALSPQCESSQHEFSLKQAFRSERSTFYSMLAMVTAFFLKRFFLN
jgi:protein-S-isoprenylcysteine O-methyltransferase Ste14